VNEEKINNIQESDFDEGRTEPRPAADDFLEDLLPPGINPAAHELGRIQEELKQWKDRSMRQAAEMENYKKRSEREKFDAILRANERLIREMLPVLDNLERALDNPGEVSRETPFYTGVDMIRDEINKLFARHGLEAVDALGKPFDPNLHEAINQTVDNTVEENTVTGQMQKGYSFENRLLRPALVVVSKKA
jgi:molecular chaperone GrpE